MKQGQAVPHYKFGGFDPHTDLREQLAWKADERCIPASKADLQRRDTLLLVRPEFFVQESLKIIPDSVCNRLNLPTGLRKYF
ncbi:MAG: hypothetical protein ACYC4F_09835 [Armatimonadota bacterium]